MQVEMVNQRLTEFDANPSNALPDYHGVAQELMGASVYDGKEQSKQEQEEEKSTT